MRSWNKADVTARMKFIVCMMMITFLKDKMCLDIEIFV